MKTTLDEKQLPDGRLWQPVTGRWFAGVFGFSLLYAILRYHIAGDVLWIHFPLFILNKATAMSAVIFVACSYLIGRVIKWHNDEPRIKLVVIKFCGLMGFSLAFMHAFLSVCQWSPAYFAKYFADDGRMNLQGELGMTAGVVALWALSIPAITTLPMMPKALGGVRWKRTQRMGYFCLCMVVVHLFVLGIKGWISPSDWPWSLPPISMLACIAAIIPIVTRFKVYRSTGK